MIATLAALGLLLTGCANGDDSGASDSATVVPESGGGNADTSEGAEGTHTTDDGSGDDAAADASDLTGTTWTVTNGEGADLSVSPTEDAGAYVKFAADGRVEGYSGCNSFGGSAEISDGTIAFSQMIATKRACMGAAGDIESVVLATLNGEATYEIDGDTLTISHDGATLTLQAGSAQ